MSKFDFRLEQIQQDLLSGNRKSFYGKFAQHQYNLAQMNLENARNPFNSFSEKPNLHVNNYYQMRFERPFNFLVEKGLIKDGMKPKVELQNHPLHKIMNIFAKNSLFDIMKLLK